LGHPINPGRYFTMTVGVLIAHAKGEENFAEQLASPIRSAGYEVAHEGTVLVGDSLIEVVSILLAERAPVVLCATVRAMGTRWARQVARAACSAGSRLFAVQMEQDANVEAVSFDETFLQYWEDPARAKRAGGYAAQILGLQEIEWVVLGGHSTGSMHGYWLSGAWSASEIRHDEAWRDQASDSIICQMDIRS
jgi:hypothetical protein